MSTSGRTGELQRSVAEGLVFATLSGALSLSCDALATAPRTLPHAFVLGASCGALLGLPLGLARFVTGRLKPLLALLLWVTAGAGVGFVTAVGIGALENLRGQRQVLAILTLLVAISGGAIGGAALAFVQAPALRARLAARARLVRLSIGGAAFLLCAAVAVAPLFARWLLVYPLAMKAVVVVAFLFAYCAVSSLELGWERGNRWRWATLPVAAVALLALGLAPPGTLSGLLGTNQNAQLLVQLRALTDLDRDGASSWFGDNDCAPRNRKVHPRAREVPGNGMDDNCLLGDAKPLASSQRAVPVRPEAPSPVSVVLITIDALRADHTQPYGYHKATTPNLNRFAQGARRYERAFTAGGRTGLGLVTLLGGAPAREQRWQLVPRAREPGTTNRMPWDVVPREWAVSPVPHWLARRGMRTAAVLHFGAASWFAEGQTFDPEFQRFVVAPDRDALPDTATVDAALAVLKEVAESPYFLWVHLYGPHDPHTRPPRGAPDFGGGIAGAYDSDIWQSDRELGRLLAGLDQQPGPPAVVVITSDHSEELAGDRTFHAVDMFGETTRVPLLVRGPGIEGGVDDRIVSAIDIAPSIMAWTQTPSPFSGYSLTEPARRRVAITDTFRPARKGGLNMEQVVATDGRHRYVIDFETGREAYLPEQNVFAGSGGALSAAAMRQLLLEYVEHSGPPDTVEGPLPSKPGSKYAAVF